MELHKIDKINDHFLLTKPICLLFSIFIFLSENNFWIFIQHCVCFVRFIEIDNKFVCIHSAIRSIEEFNVAELWSYIQTSKSEANEIFTRKYGGKPIKITLISTYLVTFGTAEHFLLEETNQFRIYSI